MGTVEKLKNMDIHLDVSEKTLKDIAEYDKYNKSYEDIKKMSKEERSELLNDLHKKLDEAQYESDNSKWNKYYSCFLTLTNVMDEEYREENMEEFRAYEAKMNEPDFDWGFYSDWHKDMFGYRPHKQVIPKDEEEREKNCKDFHKERGL